MLIRVSYPENSLSISRTTPLFVLLQVKPQKMTTKSGTECTVQSYVSFIYSLAKF